MYPTIRDGETVTVEPVCASEVRRGDILLYQTTSRVIAHRVVEIVGAQNSARVFTLRGDSLRSCDAPVRAEQVLGRVVSVERKGREINLKAGRSGIHGSMMVRAVRLRRGLRQGLGLLRSFRKPKQKGICGQLEKG
jgi:signal peptidase